MILLYGVLWIGGRATLPSTHHWASLDGYESLLGQQARSTGTEAQNAFADAAEALLATPRSTLGLFPRYEERWAEEAIRHLQTAYAATQDPFHRAEVSFFLAKAYLMKNDVSEARYWLELVETHQVADYRNESRRLLQSIDP